MDALRQQMAADRRRLREGQAASHRQRRQALRARRWPRVRSPLDDIDLDFEFGPRPAAVSPAALVPEPAVDPVVAEPAVEPAPRTLASTAPD